MSYFWGKKCTMKIFQFILFLFLLNVAPVWSQSHYILDNLSAIKDKNRVIINWTIKRGNSCIGIGIFRSVDRTNYELIGEIQGICGSTEFAQAFHFIDENPVKNKTNYYNPNNVLHRLYIFDAIGKRVWDSKTNGDKFPISLTDLEEIEIASFNFNTTKYYYYITDNSGKKVSSGIFFDVKN